MNTVIFEDKERLYTINEVAEKADIHPQTLRNWERTELLKPQRISGNQRIYTKKDLDAIEQICELKSEGWNLQAIKGYIAKLKEEKESTNS